MSVYAHVAENFIYFFLTESRKPKTEPKTFRFNNLKRNKYTFFFLAVDARIAFCQLNVWSASETSVVETFCNLKNAKTPKSDRSRLCVFE